ncbi:MAG: nucleoside-diphosphate sugar epimerase/dehydratase [Verrucomicrobiales bacterium]|nr:nucleoside-diphosphate sugar epimerase/dehydratase [Verrucomicrobiales bacterium]
MQFLINLFKESTAIRRCFAFLFHVAGIVLAYTSAHLIRFDFNVPENHWQTFKESLGWVIVAYVACIVLFRMHQGLWRFFTLRDCLMTTIAFSVGTVAAASLVFVSNGFTFEDVSRSVFIISFLLLLLWEIGARGLVRLFREERQSRRGHSDDRRIVLFGDPEEADALLRSVQSHAGELGKVVGIISENQTHNGAKLRGVRIYAGVEDVSPIVKKLQATTLLFMPPFTGPRRIRGVIDSLSKEKISCDYRVIPSMDELASGRISVSSIRKVAIEDLLPRVPYHIAADQLEGAIGGRRVMVSGAGGSIGSEICRQLLRFKPEVIVLFEISEFHLFNVEREIKADAEAAGVEVIAVAGDVRRADQMRAAMRRAGGVDLFYHAAAYKHVDLMERNPVSCFQNNVIGTEVAASVSEEEGVSDFVLVSTDKAVRPTSLMGSSKRLAERLLIERPLGKTSFKAVRFGNVLGSNGSVVPIFRSQIAKGGPVTVTSPEVTRFFMTIPEAVELVLAAGAVEEDRRIFVLEMGEAVKIDSMARRMIELSGLVPDVDIPIVYTGLKSGEKEYEELLTDDENVVRTDLDRIWVVEKDAPGEAPPVELGRLLELIDDVDEEGLRLYAHSLIPGSKLMENR